MANFLRIAVVAPRAPQDDPRTGQLAFDRMIHLWQHRFEQVLPDRPDLIVVPEACDRFPSQTLEQRRAYYETRGNQIRDFFAAVARKHNCHITYPAAWKLADGTWRNRLQIIGADGGILGHYDKNHTIISEITEAGMPSPCDEIDGARATACCQAAVESVGTTTTNAMEML